MPPVPSSSTITAVAVYSFKFCTSKTSDIAALEKVCRDRLVLPHSKNVAQVHPTEISRLKGTAKLFQEDRMVLNSKLLKPCENLQFAIWQTGSQGECKQTSRIVSDRADDLEATWQTVIEVLPSDKPQFQLWSNCFLQVATS